MFGISVGAAFSRDHFVLKAIVNRGWKPLLRYLEIGVAIDHDQAY